MSDSTAAYAAFDRYTIFSLYVVAAFAPVAAILAIASFREHTSWTWLFEGALAVLFVTTVLLLRPAMDRFLTGMPLPRARLVSQAVAGVAAAIFAALATPATTETGLALPTSLLTVTLGLAAAPLAVFLSYTWVWGLALAAGALIAANWVRLAAPLDPEATSPP